jgi:hypothetical protein
MALVVPLALFDVSAAGAGSSSSAPVEPVPSLEPAATDALWKKLVEGRRLAPPAAADAPAAVGEAGCRPLRASFYAATDWLRLATKLAATASPCAEYFISVPPLAANKTQPRADQAWRIRALGPNFHALAEISMTGWATWVADTGSGWFDAGVEARRRMAAAGYDVSRGDSWALNELSSAVRRGDGAARDNARAFMRGLFQGDGTLPAVRGLAFVTGIAQSTTELSVYQARLQDWFEDGPFWADMRAYVSDWSQEDYGDVRNYAVVGATLTERRDALAEYLHHDRLLARAGPAAAAEARAFLDAAASPLANAAWQYESGFGWTLVSAELMQHYVSAQAYALRHGGTTGRAGYAWAPKNATGMTATEFTSQTGAILDRLAAAIRDSAESDLGACGASAEWCAGSLDGAWLNRGWASFATWKPSLLAFSTAPHRLAVGEAATLTVELRTHTGVPLTVTRPLAVTVTSSSSAGRFSPAPDGPWTGTLTAAIPTGSSTVTFYYRDDTAGNPVVTATATGKQPAAQTQTIVGPQTSPPDTTITSGPAATTGATTATFGLSASTPASFECRLDGGSWSPCVSPAQVVGLVPGAHVFEARAVSGGEADATPARRDVRVVRPFAELGVAVWRPSDGVWYRQAGPWVQWGADGDVPVPGDYDGDGTIDVAVWRPATGVWYVAGGAHVQWGAPDDVPVPADYDGDGDTDLAVWRPSSGVWYVRGVGEWQWGAPGDVPLPGDYDGDPQLDLAVWRPATGVWHIAGGAQVQWGAAGDVPVPADYDGNGKIDIAVWRPANGIWYVRDGVWRQWGAAEDIPVPRDRDGDGDADVGVWRPSNGVWYDEGGSQQWGSAGDVP